jgi:effector-binding domain-containing protein
VTGIEPVPTSPVTVVAVDPRPTAVVAQTTSWDEFPTLWSQLLDEVYNVVRGGGNLAHESQADSWQNVMLYKDDTPSVEVGVLTVGPFEAQDRVVASQLPGGTAAMAIHRGDYAGLSAAHAAVLDYVKAHGLGLAGPRWEVYGHWRADPAELETEIYYLLDRVVSGVDAVGQPT